MVLNPLLPVKYSSANGYWAGAVYRKSTRRARAPTFSRATTKHLALPHDSTSRMIPRPLSPSMNCLNRAGFSDVKMTSMSPEVAAPRR